MAKASAGRGLDIVRRLIRSNEIMAEVLNQNMGRIGAALIVVFVLVSIYALATIPLDFYVKWNQRELWEVYPTVAPPSWVSALGEPVAKHVMRSFTEPNDTRLFTAPRKYHGVELLGYAEFYDVGYELDSPAFPQGVLITIDKVALGSFRYRGRVFNASNVLTTVYVFLHRPDGVTLLLNEPKPVSLSDLAAAKVIRFSDSFVADQVLQMLAGKYNLTKDYVQNNAVRFAFGVYDGSTVKPLEGEYTVEVVVTYLARGIDPARIRAHVDAGDIGVEELGVVIKGSAYGAMGTDDYGRDIYTALLYSFPIELLIGFFAAVVSVVIGLLLGVISGYYGGWVDEIIQRTIDIMGSIPVLPILVLVGASLQERGASPWAMLLTIIGFLIVFGWGGLALIVRSMTLSIKSEPYIDSARALGASNIRIIFKHVIPQIVPYAMASLVFSVPAAVITEAGLSVLGIRHNLPTWGTVLADARDYIYAGGRYDIWWWILPPGILMGLMSVAFVFLGLAMETVVEPRLKRR